MTKNQKYDFINSFRGALMILVIVGHFLQVIENTSSDIASPFIRSVILLIYSFHMPLFVCLSGYLSGNLEKRRDRAFEDLFVPFVIFQILFGLLNVRLSAPAGFIKDFLIPQPGLWYLLALFIWRITLKDMVKVKGIYIITFLLNTFTCFFNLSSELSLQRVIGFLFWFMVGYYLNTKEVLLKKIINTLSKVPSFIAGIIILAEAVAIYLIISNHNELYYSLLEVFCHRIYFKDFQHWYIAPVLYILAFAAAIFNILLFVILFKKSNKICIYIGADTMPVYISHLVLYVILLRLPVSGWIMVILSLVLASISCVLFPSKIYTRMFKKCVSFVTIFCLKTYRNKCNPAG